MPATRSMVIPSISTLSSRSKCLSLLKIRPHSYSPWRAPMSQRQINAYFEQEVLPELSALLEGAFQELPEWDREEAIQDATCLALEAWRTLRLYETSCKGVSENGTPRALATFASRRYLAGVRFADPRSASHL